MNGDINCMSKTFVYFQPEYVSKFKCNGQECEAHCCKYWRIDIDRKTYKRYNTIKPKSKAQEITQLIKSNENKDRYTIKLKKSGFCPFLTEDNWCKIQKTYGADFLSNICMTYPRVTFQIKDFFERSLTITCPIAANLVLNQTEPMAFEQIEISTKEHFDSCRDLPNQFVNFPSNLIDYIINIQYAVISILQERSLKIDQRLIVMGYFLDQLEEIIKEGHTENIETLSMIYTSEDFLKNQVPTLIESIEFNNREYMRIMFETFDMLYRDNKYIKSEAQRYLDFVAQALEVKTDEDGTASISELVERYKYLNPTRKKFLEKKSIIFENYLVQEFFTGLYPFRISGSISTNYGLFLVTYKILELISVSMVVVNDELREKTGKSEMTDKHLISLIQWFVQKLDHGVSYTDKIRDGLREKDNTIKIMRALLQG